MSPAWHVERDLLCLEGQVRGHGGFGRQAALGAKRLWAIRDKNAKLKRLLADAMLDNAGLKDLLAKTW